MPVVADAGPLIHLAQSGQIRLLQNIFKEAFIVRAVKREVVDEGLRRGYSDAVLVVKALEAGYIVVHKLDSRTSKRAFRLASQENVSYADSETLLLAKVLKAPLLTDEKILSALAKMYGLEVWSTWSVLLEGLRRRLIDRQVILEAVTELGERRHKLSPANARQILDAADRIAASKSS